MWMSAWRAKVDAGRAVMPIKVTFLRLSAGMMAVISSLSPELEIATTTSLSTIMPKSPCAASAGWTKNAGVPVDAIVAAIFRPTCPDFAVQQGVGGADETAVQRIGDFVQAKCFGAQYPTRPIQILFGVSHHVFCLSNKNLYYPNAANRGSMKTSHNLFK